MFKISIYQTMYAFILLLTSILRLFGKDPKDPVPSLRSSGNVLNSFNCNKNSCGFTDYQKRGYMENNLTLGIDTRYTSYLI